MAIAGLMTIISDTLPVQTYIYLHFLFAYMHGSLAFLSRQKAPGHDGRSGDCRTPHDVCGDQPNEPKATDCHNSERCWSTVLLFIRCRGVSPKSGSSGRRSSGLRLYRWVCMCVRQWRTILSRGESISIHASDLPKGNGRAEERL